MERRNFIKGSAIAALSASTLPIAAANPRVDRRQWDAAMRRYEAADDHYHACVARLRRKYGREVDAPHDELAALDDLCSTVSDRESDLEQIPAPDLAALRWKLDRLRESNGEMVPWAGHAVRQTFSDIARLMPRAG